MEHDNVVIAILIAILVAVIAHHVKSVTAWEAINEKLS